MTDEDLAVLILETRDSEPDPFWLPSDDIKNAWRDLPRVRAVWARIARRVRNQLEADKREQTAATILAALIRLTGRDSASHVVWAAQLADQLRAELAKTEGKP